MMTVNEVSKMTGVSVRTLHYYDEIGLLKPAVTTDAGYRLYDAASLERLQQILLLRELEFPLKDIKNIVCRDDFDRKKAISQQIKLLSLKKERLEKLISFMKKYEETGEFNMNFNVFDKKKIEKYKLQAQKSWGDTSYYKEFEKKTAGLSDEKQTELGKNMMEIFGEFGAVKDKTPDSPEAEALVIKLKNFITENYYDCTDEILCGLGKLYGAGGEFTENIDAAGGKGTAVFAADAIEKYCENRK